MGDDTVTELRHILGVFTARAERDRHSKAGNAAIVLTYDDAAAVVRERIDALAAVPVAVPDGLTDLPDAVVEAAAEAMKRIVPNTDGVLWEFEDTDPNTGEPVQPRPVTLHDAARAALAAASGPWAEQLDAAKAERDELQRVLDMQPVSMQLFDQINTERLDLRTQLAAALARNAELETLKEQYHEEWHIAAAELDNLRDRVNALADEWATPGEFRGAGNNLARADCAKELRAAIVRGSDDE